MEHNSSFFEELRQIRAELTENLNIYNFTFISDQERNAKHKWCLLI